MGIKVIDLLNNTDKTLFSFELLPPLKGEDIKAIYHTIDPLMEFNPPYINVTYHQEEVVYRKVKENLLEKKTIWKRPGTVAISASIKYKYKVAVVPHIICGGFTKEETENALLDLNFLGMNNVLAIRGDAPADTKIFVPEAGGHHHAVDIVKQIMKLNKGIYLDKELENKKPTSFSVGVAGYPEKHPESPNMDSDIHFLKKKIDAGAEYIVTQMFFDNNRYVNFVDKCRMAGIKVPIIPGLKPIAALSHLNYLSKTFSIDIPDLLVKEVLKCKDNNQVREVGIEWAVQQSKELIKYGVPVLHYYTMGKPDNIRKIAERVF
ncbi:MAG: methylenetetrahydrofolate reductase [NAD(P)H] [Bacteroidota bacterium]|nr:methylenetetrahydrofolate reductase [NAD(P)H] [Bacteroidota bacterium]